LATYIIPASSPSSITSLLYSRHILARFTAPSFVSSSDNGCKATSDATSSAVTCASGKTFSTAFTLVGFLEPINIFIQPPHDSFAHFIMLSEFGLLYCDPSALQV